MRKAFLFVVLAFSSFTSFAQEVEFESSDIPIFIVNTFGEEIPNEPKVDAHLGIIDNGDARNYVTDPFNGYDGKIGIEIRGNGTAVLDKASLLFETRHEDGSNNNVEILGLPKENDWILYAPWVDKSLIRNILTYDLANRMGMYSSRCRFVELIVNGEYRGVFVLMEKIKRDKNRVDVVKYDEEIEDPSQLGYVVRIDSWFHHTKGWTSDIYQVNEEDRSVNFQYVYPKYDHITDPQREYIADFVQDFEVALNEAEPPYIAQAIEEKIDINSFIDFFMIQELGKNPDAYRLSTYFFKDVDGKITMGPMWDHNFCYGNYYSYEDVWIKWEYDNHWFDYPAQIPFWWDKLLKDSTYVAVLNERWEMFRNNGIIECNTFSDLIDGWVEEVYESQERNFVKWPVLGVNSAHDWNAGPLYEDEIEYLKNWLCNRIEWLDVQFPRMKRQFDLVEFDIRPNPTSLEVNIDVQAVTTDEYLLHFYNLQGQLVKAKSLDLIKGYSENSVDVSDLSPGMYIVKFPELKSFSARKMIIH